MQALENLRAAGVKIDIAHHQDGQGTHYLSIMRIPAGLTARLEPKDLCEGFYALNVWHGDGHKTTLWIDVEDPLLLATTVQTAIENSRSSGYGMFLSCRGAVSHAPGQLLSGGIMAALKDISRGGWIWHPIANRLIEQTLSPYH